MPDAAQRALDESSSTARDHTAAVRTWCQQGHHRRRLHNSMAGGIMARAGGRHLIVRAAAAIDLVLQRDLVHRRSTGRPARSMPAKGIRRPSTASAPHRQCRGAAHRLDPGGGIGERAVPPLPLSALSTHRATDVTRGSRASTGVIPPAPGRLALKGGLDRLEAAASRRRRNRPSQPALGSRRDAGSTVMSISGGAQSHRRPRCAARRRAVARRARSARSPREL